MKINYVSYSKVEKDVGFFNGIADKSRLNDINISGIEGDEIYDEDDNQNFQLKIAEYYRNQRDVLSKLSYQSYLVEYKCLESISKVQRYKGMNVWSNGFKDEELKIESEFEFANGIVLFGIIKVTDNIFEQSIARLFKNPAGTCMIATKKDLLKHSIFDRHYFKLRANNKKSIYYCDFLDYGTVVSLCESGDIIYRYTDASEEAAFYSFYDVKKLGG